MKRSRSFTRSASRIKSFSSTRRFVSANKTRVNENEMRIARCKSCWYENRINKINSRVRYYQQLLIVFQSLSFALHIHLCDLRFLRKLFLLVNNYNYNWSRRLLLLLCRSCSSRLSKQWQAKNNTRKNVSEISQWDEHWLTQRSSRSKSLMR